jgi:hypothetical protein
MPGAALGLLSLYLCHPPPVNGFVWLLLRGVWRIAEGLLALVPELGFRHSGVHLALPAGAAGILVLLDR